MGLEQQLGQDRSRVSVAAQAAGRRGARWNTATEPLSSVPGSGTRGLPGLRRGHLETVCAGRSAEEQPAGQLGVFSGRGNVLDLVSLQVCEL